MSDDGLLRVWRLDDGKCLVGLGVSVPPEQFMLNRRLNAVVHLGGGKVAIGADDGYLQLWDVGAALAEEAAGRGPGPEGFPSGARPPPYRLWKAGPGPFAKNDSSQPFRLASIAAVGEELVAAGYGCGSVRLWRVADGSLAHELLGSGRAQEVVDALALVAIPADRRGAGLVGAPAAVLAASTHAGSIKFWDTATWDLAGEVVHGENVWIVGLAPLPGGRLAACENSAPGLIRLWDVPSLTCLATVDAGTPHNGGLWAIAALSGDRGLVTGGEGGLIRMWHIREGGGAGGGGAVSLELVEDLGGRAETHPQSVMSVAAFHADGSGGAGGGGSTWLLSGAQNEIRVWAAVPSETDGGEAVMAVHPGGSKRVLSLPRAGFVRGLLVLPLLTPP